MSSHRASIRLFSQRAPRSMRSAGRARPSLRPGAPRNEVTLSLQLRSEDTELRAPSPLAFAAASTEGEPLAHTPSEIDELRVTCVRSSAPTRLKLMREMRAARTNPHRAVSRRKRRSR